MPRLFDRLLEWLMRPSVRRFRRWSSLITVPVAVIVASLYGVGHGLLVVALRLTLWAAVVIAAWRLGGERGEALRDLLMHPRARAFLRAELDVVTVLPRLVLVRALGQEDAGMTYHRGTFGLALALAFTPALAAEAVALHLLLHGSVLAWIATGLQVYALIWLWGFALGPRAYPHRVGICTAVLGNGPMYRVRVPLYAITSAKASTERVGDGRGLVERGGAVLLPSRGRVDVWLELAQPIGVQRPLHEPLITRYLAVPSDDPDRLVERLVARATSPVQRGDAAFGALAAFELAGGARDAMQSA